jgi:hypothetical protein
MIGPFVNNLSAPELFLSLPRLSHIAPGERSGPAVVQWDITLLACLEGLCLVPRKLRPRRPYLSTLAVWCARHSSPRSTFIGTYAAECEE